MRLGAWMPFEQAAELMEAMRGVTVSKSTTRRMTEAAGSSYVQLQTEEAERLEGELPQPEKRDGKLQVSADGVLVPLVGGEWAEVKNLVVGVVQPAVQERGEWVVHTRQLSYFSRLMDAEQFKHAAYVEIYQRRVEGSCQVAAILDGAEWEQNLINYYREDAVRILDFPHAGQRIGQIGQVLLGEGSPAAQAWTDLRLHDLKHEGPQAILEELRQLQEQHPHWEVLRENLAYLEKREAQMQYPQFQAQGWPIGSGIVESGNKIVVEARLKGAGMHWERENVNAMLGLRDIVCSDRWTMEWPRIAAQLCREARLRQKNRREKNCQLPSPPPAEPVAECLPKVIEPAVVIPPEPTDPQKAQRPWRPAPNHPWRRSPIGSVRYQSSSPAKK